MNLGGVDMAKANPKELKYSKEHEWVKIEGNIAKCGVTDYAQEQLTDIVFIELPAIGKKVEQFKQAAVVESVKSVSDVFSPLSGEVVEVNSALKDAPEKVNQDAFGEGWMFKIKMSNPAEVKNLMSSEDYDKFIKEGKH